MDLKDFVTQTISAIIEATIELQFKYESQGVIINPPVSIKEPNLYEHEDVRHRYRRVEVVEFDVAVTASSESSGGVKAGLRVWTIEAGVDGRHSQNSEEISHVRFRVPIVLSPATVETMNRVAAEEYRANEQDRTKKAQ